MTDRDRLLAMAMLIVVSLWMNGCGKREAPKPPPGVTQEMENAKLPTIELGSPSGSSATPDTPQQSHAKTK